MLQLSLINRLQKNFQRLKGPIKDGNIEAYRIYDRDMPDYPYICEVWGNWIILTEKGRSDSPEELSSIKKKEFEAALIELFNIEPKKIILKTRQKQKGTEQYQRIGHEENFFPIEEGKLQFLVNLTDYLDTGLFIDHRPLRKKLSEASSEHSKMLNLFSYTCSLGVASAYAGFKTTNVDLSKTYLDWGKKNYLLNKINLQHHQFIFNDVFKFLLEDKQKYDLIVLDPPTFSNSKRMTQILDTQRDHPQLIANSLERLNPNGQLFFSTNKRGFKMEFQSDKCKINDISSWSIPKDFRDAKCHRLYQITFISPT